MTSSETVVPFPGERAPLPGPVTLDPSSLRVEGNSRSQGIDDEHVRVLAEVFDALPPILVHRATLRVVDGVHRVRAAQVLGRDGISVVFFDGDGADAFVAGVRANAAHGLPLNLADRKAAAATILRTHPHWSDRMIAGVVGLSPKTVGQARTGRVERRTGRDGRVRAVDCAEKRKLAGRLLREDPSLSLRQVARAVGISPETARSVKASIGRGEDPVGGGAVVALPSQEPARPDWAGLVHRLRADPSLRFTETGRALLRLLDVHAVNDGRWASIASSVPPHCRQTIAQVAGEFARAWHTFAEQLEHPTTGA